MKKFLLGLALFLGGQIGLSGWLIASTSLVERGGGKSVVVVLRCGDGVAVAVLFVLMAIVGLVLAIYEITQEK